jgi:hypothetical protein
LALSGPEAGALIDHDISPAAAGLKAGAINGDLP